MYVIKRFLRVLRTCILIVISTIVMWLFLETGTRVFHYLKFGNAGIFKYGFPAKKMTGNKEVHERFYDAQGNTIYYKCKPSNAPQFPINSNGFRGPEIKQKQTGSIRIICLGGSTTYGLTLTYDETYPKLLQDILDRAVGKNHYDVINAGISAFKLCHIIELAKNEIIALQPDMVILMSVFNNLHRQGQNFGFTAIKSEGQNRAVRLANKIKEEIKHYSLLALTIDEFALKGLHSMYQDIDWETAAKIIMSKENSSLWANYQQDLNNLFDLFLQNSIDVIVVDEAFNRINFPELAPPIDKATNILFATSANYANVTTLVIGKHVNKAKVAGEKVWNGPLSDPVHLTKEGNRIIAELIALRILDLSQN